MDPLPEQPAAHVEFRTERHAAEAAAVDVRDSVVPGEPLVDKRVVGIQQIDHAAVLVDDALDEQLGFFAESLPQIVVEIGEHRTVGTWLCKSRRFSHWPAKFVTSASERGIGQHPLDLLFEDGRIAQLVLARPASSSSSSGMLLHRKNDRREASSRSLMRYFCPGRDAGRLNFFAEHKFGIRQDAAKRHFDALIEQPVVSALLIEAQQHLSVLIVTGRRKA